jgi:AAA+ superfamily predicted ATPase
LLTSNRVGTFDEAFKSRIQLSIHYDNLDLSQRKRIWENFIERLDSLEENVDIADLRSNIKELAANKLNGRQICNAITTARQLASFKKEQMDINHLRRVLKVSAKFDKYILDIQDGVTDEEIAREDRRR